MTKIDDLTFDYQLGACNTFSKFGILFCFDHFRTQNCHSMNISKNGTLTIKKNEISSKYEHYKVISLASYRGSPFVTGSYNPNHSKTELLNIDDMKWKTKTDFPSNGYLSSYLFCFSFNQTQFFSMRKTFFPFFPATFAVHWQEILSHFRITFNSLVKEWISFNPHKPNKSFINKWLRIPFYPHINFKASIKFKYLFWKFFWNERCRSRFFRQLTYLRKFTH